MSIKLVTHTGSDLSLWEAEQLNITIIPDVVVVNNTAYKNMYEITAEDFYAKMAECKNLPTSSHPSVGDYCSAFKAEIEKNSEIEKIFFMAVTSKMSGSYATAVSAAKLLKEEGFETPIYVYDSLQCSHGMAAMVREAGRLIKIGYDVDEIIAKLDEYRSKVAVYFVLGSLKYAKEGGRVGAIKALAADTLGIKPLLVFEDGLVRDYGIAKNFEGGMEKILDKYEKEADFSRPLTVFHGAAPEKAKAFESAIRERHPMAMIRTEDVGPVIGLYAGPGGAGLAFIRK